MIFNPIKIYSVLNSVVGTATRYGLVRGSNPDGARFSAPVHTSYTMGTESSPGVKWPGRDVEHTPHLSPRLKKEENYTSTPPLGFRLLLQAEIYFSFIWRNSPR